MGTKSYIKNAVDKVLGQKVNPVELENLRQRKVLLDTKNLEHLVVRNEYLNYINLVLDQHGLNTSDPKKNFKINLATGVIEEYENTNTDSGAKKD